MPNLNWSLFFFVFIFIFIHFWLCRVFIPVFLLLFIFILFLVLFYWISCIAWHSNQKSLNLFYLLVSITHRDSYSNLKSKCIDTGTHSGYSSMQTLWNENLKKTFSKKMVLELAIFILLCYSILWKFGLLLRIQPLYHIANIIY